MAKALNEAILMNNIQKILELITDENFDPNEYLLAQHGTLIK